jgi:uncharacterized protein YigE (DUF2233 family)
MLMRRIVSVVLYLFLLLLSGCGASNLAPTAPPTRVIPTLFPTTAVRRIPTEGGASPAALPAASATPDSGWQLGSPGVELRQIQAAAAPDRAAVPLVIVRIDPAQVQLRVAYAPDRPRGLRSWFEERRPLAAINGSFFTPENRATGLIISDGSPSGTSYAGFGGMLSVAPGGGVSLRALSDQPYDPAEPIEQALQSFPMLVFPGGVPAAIEDDGRRARRSAVAIDRAGRLLLLVSPTSDFTLRGLADWLSQSDLDVDRALNLDGGSSTGLYLRAGALHQEIDSFGPLPIVLLVEEK